MTTRVSKGTTIRRNQAQSRLRSNDVPPRISYLPGLKYANPYTMLMRWTPKKDRAVKKIPSLRQRFGQSFLQLFLQPVLTYLSGSREIVLDVHACLQR
ncbi:hypothetical protein ARMSODRAFT_964138 [Armillaria solidipes]|uniref:Uncharacterized protein n=1 Tax=Armillaria solidipes TaxID=1076256 RepID=A0A2H3BF37_9AGAR|nr:hypothetical protein ARMSODRAFT_964138 [Armillaria solidipes]